MTRKKDITAGKSSGAGKSWDPENAKYYFPVLLLVMLIGLMIIFGDFIFSDKMLYGSDMINAGIFFRHFYVDFVKTHGSIPAWNPYVFGGLPFVDAFHGDILYPLSVLKFFGNLFRMLGFNLIIHFFLAGIFMYFTARQFRLRRIGATCAAIAYMFSGLLVSWVAPGHDGKIFVVTLFPLAILFLDRAFEKKPILNFALLGLVIGLIILTPHLQLAYYSLWAIAFYTVFKLILLYRETKSVGTLVKPSGLFVAAVAIGLMISAIQFYPGYIYTTKYSPRADTKRGYDWATSWSMHEEEAFSLAVPEFSGTKDGENNFYWGKNVFKDNSEYAGVIPLFLAVIAVFFYRRREAIFFGALALFALIYGLGGTTPLFRVFFYLIPNVKSLRAPATVMFLFLFSVSLLSGMTVQYLIDKGRSLSAVTRKRLLIYLGVVPAGFLLLAFLFSAAGESMLSFYTSIFYSGIKTMTIGQQDMTKWNIALMNLPSIQRGFWIVFVLTAASAGAIWMYLSRKAGTVLLLAIPLLTMIDGIRFDSRFVSNYDYRQNTTPNAITNYLQSQSGKFRVFDLGTLPEDFLPYFNIEVVTGYHGNQLRWYDELLGGPGAPNRGNPTLLNLVGTRYLLAPSRMKVPPDYFGPIPLTVAQNFGSIVLYKNDNALPRAFLVNKYEVIPNRTNIYPEILSGKHDLRQTVFLEEAPPLAVSGAGTGAGIADIVSYANDSIVVNVNTPENAILVLTDNYYVSWEAAVDGVKTPILRADGSFRAVPLKAGSRQVVFKYNRSMDKSGRLITLVGLLLVAAAAAPELIARFRRKKHLPEVS